MTPSNIIKYNKQTKTVRLGRPRQKPVGIADKKGNFQLIKRAVRTALWNLFKSAEKHELTVKQLGNSVEQYPLEDEQLPATYRRRLKEFFKSARDARMTDEEIANLMTHCFTVIGKKEEDRVDNLPSEEKTE